MLLSEILPAFSGREHLLTMRMCTHTGTCTDTDTHTHLYAFVSETSSKTKGET